MQAKSRVEIHYDSLDLHFKTTALEKKLVAIILSITRFHIRTAKQMVDAALGEIAPEDAEKLWVDQSKIVAQQTNDEAIDFRLSSRCACRMLQECRTMGITKRNRIYYVRQTDGFRNLTKLASWSYSVQV